MKIGVVSDTHGLLRPEVLPPLAGVDHILHLGDVGNIDILDTLKQIAPVTAIRGNVDYRGPCSLLPETEVLSFEGRYIYLLHDLSAISLDPAAAKFAAVLSGHTHKSASWIHKGVLYFNPGSCGPRRFTLPISIGFLHLLADGTIKAEVLDLEVNSTS